MRDSQDQYFLKLAHFVATRATCPRRQVGSVIINRHSHIMATGYNGVPKGHAHCTTTPCGGQDAPSGQSLDACMATHAEQNALLQCNDVMSIDTIYLTVSPCLTCAKLIANTSCQRVVCSEEYVDSAGVQLLRKLGIEVKHERIRD